MRYESYSKAERSCRRNPRPFYRIDVVLFNTEPQDDGTDKCVDGEYYEHDGDGHPFECIFDDRDEAFAYAETFTVEMAREALETSTNYVRYDHVAVEVTELDEGFNPCGAIACHDWMYGTKLESWHYEECEGRVA